MLQQIGTGTLILTGANVYSGGTSIFTGTLQVGNGGTTGSITGATTLYLGGVLAFDRSDTITYSDVIGNGTGGGSLVQLGSGTLVLTNNASPLGGTTISAGTLQIGSGGTAGSLTGNITDNGTLALDRSDGITLAGGISGNGALVNILGTSVLTNTDTYNGGTTITAGTLQIGAGGTAGSITGNVTDNGTLAFSRSDGVTYAGIISGSGSLIVAGKLTLTGVNTFNGTTTINSSTTLALTGTGAIAASSLADNGTFDISGITASGTSIISLSGSGAIILGAKTLTITNGGGSYTGSISDGGAGGSVVVASGTESLVGNNSYSGGTVVDANSTLVVASPASLGHGTVTFLSGSVIKFTSGGTYTEAGFFNVGAPVFDTGGNVVTWSGQLTGPGDLAVTGAGTLILTNATNGYAGGTEVYGGAALQIAADGDIGGVGPLQLGDATTAGILQLGASFNLASTRTITLNAGGGTIDTQTFSTTVSQAITGTGGLTKLGSGTLTLAGTNTYAGATTVKAGSLLVSGSLGAGAVGVASGGKLGGTGKVGATTIASGGILTPGIGGVGTLTVSGALTLASGSTTAMDVTAAAADAVVATGAASLNGTLALSVASGSYAAGTDFKLISAASVSGTFATITGNSFSGLNSTLVYSANAVDLKLSAIAAPPVSFVFGSYGTTPNQVAAGTAVSAGATSGAVYTALGGLVTSNAAGVPAALDSLSGEIYPALRTAMVADSRLIRDAVLDHLAKASADGMVPWGTGFASSGSIDGNGNTATLSHNDTGLIAGLDMPVGDDLRAGIAGAFTVQKLAIPNRASSAAGQSSHIIAYADWALDALRLRLGADYAWGSNSVRRSITFLSQNDASHQDDHTSQLFGEAGYSVQTNGVLVEPYAGIAYITASSGAFAESGGASSLSGAGKTDALGYSTLGVHFLPDAVMLGDIDVMPKIGFGWQHALGGFARGQNTGFIATAQSFQVEGAMLSTDAVVGELGFEVAVFGQGKFSLGYDGLISDHEKDNAVTAAFRWSF